MEKKALTKNTMANNASKVWQFLIIPEKRTYFSTVLGSYAAYEQYSQFIFCVRCT